MCQGIRKFLQEWVFSTLFCFLLYDLLWMFADFADFKVNFGGYIEGLLIDLAYCAAFSFTSIVVSRKILLLKLENIHGSGRKKLLVSGITLFAANLAVAGLCEVLAFCVDDDFFQNDIWGTFFLFALIASNITLIHLAKHYAHMLIQKENENIALQKKYLKLQLDPHFVLNSLSSLAGMIEIAPDKAEQYVVKLSHVYRHLMLYLDKNYIGIDKAIEMGRDYVELLNLRYSGKITMRVEKMEMNKNEAILASGMQLLIENAVKHNYPNGDNILCIQIERQNNMLIIRNNRIYTYNHNNQSIDSYGIGLANLR